MENSIYRYVIRHSLRAQIVLTLIAVASFPFLYAFYELPKQIVNQVIQGGADGFPAVVLGLSFSQIEYLFILCGGFLLLVVANQAFKYAINVLAGRTGERMLRRLRYDLYSRGAALSPAALPQAIPGRDHHHDHRRGGAPRRGSSAMRSSFRFSRGGISSSSSPSCWSRTG